MNIGWWFGYVQGLTLSGSQNALHWCKISSHSTGHPKEWVNFQHAAEFSESDFK